MKLGHHRDRLIHRRLRALADTLPLARTGAPDGVHKARVATRRLRETLPVVLDGRRSRKVRRLRKEMRRLTRALGPVREMDVTLGLLGAVTLGHPEGEASLEAVRQLLEFERQARWERMVERIDRFDAGSFGERLEQLAASRPVGDAERITRQGLLAVRIARRTKALQRAIEEAGSLYAPEPLHAVRIAVKKLRYALELAHDLKLLRSRRPLTLLKSVQETLGDLHDRQVLLHYLADMQTRLPAAERDAADGLAPAVAALETECRELHAQYVARRERLLQTIATTADVLTSVPHETMDSAPATHSVH
jgi:CHAD domain-containing protein